MKDKKIVIVLIVITFIVLCAIIAGNNTDNTENKVETNQSEEKNEIQEGKDDIYKDDELINIFLNKYNELYANEQVTSEMLSVYSHHGSNHKDQVQFTLDDLQITLTGGNSLSKKISVSIENKANSNNDNALRNLAKRFAKVYDKELTDEKIEEHLNSQGSGSDIQTYEEIEYWTNKGLDNNIIEYIKLTGKLR